MVFQALMTFVNSLLLTVETPLEGIGTAISSVVTWITATFTSIAALFYNSTEGFTFLGVLLLVGFGLLIVWGVINFFRGIVRRG